MVASSIISEWFEKNMGLALGIASSGAGLGQVALAPLIIFFLEKFGITWAFVFLGIISTFVAFLGLTLSTPETIEEVDIEYVDFF